MIRLALIVLISASLAACTDGIAPTSAPSSVDSSGRLSTTASSEPVAGNTSHTGQVPAVPVLVSPENGVTGLPDDPTLAWNAVAGASSYDIQLGTKPTFASWNKMKWSYVGTSIRVFYDLEDYSHTFYWRVRAKNSAGVSAWSAPWSFTCATFGCD